MPQLCRCTALCASHYVPACAMLCMCLSSNLCLVAFVCRAKQDYGAQSDGKSSLLEAFLGFRFNVREVEMGTRRPLVVQMVHDAAAEVPRCRLQGEDSEEYGCAASAAPPPLLQQRPAAGSHALPIQMGSLCLQAVSVMLPATRQSCQPLQAT